MVVIVIVMFSSFMVQDVKKKKLGTKEPAGIGLAVGILLTNEAMSGFTSDTVASQKTV